MFIVRSIFVLAIIVIGCTTAPKQPSFYDTPPGFSKKQYTPEEETTITQNFEEYPEIHSEKYGELVLWKMHQKSPEFAEEFAQVPDLNDSISSKEARGMRSIYDLIKGLQITSALFKEKHPPSGRKETIVMEWEGNTTEKKDWTGWFYQSLTARILDAEPIDFEAGEDEFDFKIVEGYGYLKWKSMSGLGDIDGVRFTVDADVDNEALFLSINGVTQKFRKIDLSKKGQLIFDEKDELDGTLNVRKYYIPRLNSELYAVKEMVLAGKADYRFSAPLQALLWGYMEGKFAEDDRPFANYKDNVEFVRPIWGDMKGSRWENFDEVAGRVNTPRLFDYWLNHTIDYAHPRVGYTKPAEKTFADKWGDCSDVAELGKVFLGRAGYNVKKICTPNHVMGYIKKDGLYWVVIDFKKPGIRGENFFKGPSKRLNELITSPIHRCGPGVNP